MATSNKHQGDKPKELPYRLRLDFSEAPLELGFLFFLLKRGSSEVVEKTHPFDEIRMVNWDLFLNWVVRHKLGPPIFAIVSGADRLLVPDKVTQELRARWRQSAITALRLASQMMSVIRFLGRNGIRALPFRGVCAAQQIHGAQEAREPGDIDLFVAPEELDAVDNLLRTQGYQSVRLDFERTPLRKKKFREWAHSIEYVHPGSAVPVDVHWRLFHYRSLLPLEFNSVWDSGQVLDLAGQQVRTLSLEHTLLLSVTHAASHGWSYLSWLYDVAELVRKNRQIDWSGIICEARRLGAIRPLLQGLALGNNLLGAPIPEMAYQLIENERSLANLIAHAERRLTALDPDPSTVAENIRQIRYLFELSPSLEYKREILWHKSLHPPDWRVVELPDTLFPLYHVLRPFLWLLRKIGKGDIPRNF